MSRPGPDPTGNDEDVLSQSEALDEDVLDVDPLEAAMDPDDWSGADLHGTTATEQVSGGPLDERLEEERAGDADERPPDRTVAETPLDELDESVDDADPGAAPEEPLPTDGETLLGGEDGQEETAEAPPR